MARATETDRYPEADRTGNAAHPRETYTLIGHERAETVFARTLGAGRSHHAWLLTGPKGVGKATLAYRMARVLLGGMPTLAGGLDVAPADPVARRVEAQGHGNLFVLRRPYDFKSKRLKSEIPVDSVRAMIDFLHETPAEAGIPRMCIVDTLDDMNRSSENAILKVLEEPPAETVLLLLSAYPGRLLPTIRSRCMALRLHRVSEADLRAWLAPQTQRSGAELDWIVALAAGRPGRALMLDTHYGDVVRPIAALSSKGLSGQALGRLVGSLSGRTRADLRELFLDALATWMAAVTRAGAGGSWLFPGQAPATEAHPQSWFDLEHAIRREGVLNLDADSLLHNLLGGIAA